MSQLPLYISIVLCFVENIEIIEKLVTEINKSISPLFSDCDIVLVDNSGKEKYWKELLKIRKNNLNLKIFRQEKVTSYDDAIFRGFKESRGSYIVFPTPGSIFSLTSINEIFEYFREFSTYRAVNGVYIEKDYYNLFDENREISKLIFEEFKIFVPVPVPSIFVIKKTLFEKIFTFLPLNIDCFLPTVEAILHKYFSDQVKISYLRSNGKKFFSSYGGDAISYSLKKPKRCQKEVRDILEMLENIDGIYSFY